MKKALIALQTQHRFSRVVRSRPQRHSGSLETQELFVYFAGLDITLLVTNML